MALRATRLGPISFRNPDNHARSQEKFTTESSPPKYWDGFSSPLRSIYRTSVQLEIGEFVDLITISSNRGTALVYQTPTPSTPSCYYTQCDVNFSAISVESKLDSRALILISPEKISLKNTDSARCCEVYVQN